MSEPNPDYKTAENTPVPTERLECAQPEREASMPTLAHVDDLRHAALGNGAKLSLFTRGWNTIVRDAVQFPLTSTGVMRGSDYRETKPVFYYPSDFIEPIKNYLNVNIEPYLHQGLGSLTIVQLIRESGIDAKAGADTHSQIDIESLDAYVRGADFPARSQIGQAIVSIFVDVCSSY